MKYHIYVIDMAFSSLYMRQIMKQLKRFEHLKGTTRPSVGWIRTLREFYGMSLTIVAKRVGVVQSRVSTVEACEPQDRVTLETLRKFAHALNCDVVYAFVPREDPEQFLAKHAQKKAKEMITQLQKTMSLEDQAISETELKEHYDQLVKELLNNPKKIWENL